ncbi:MAG: DivIVA domain-containing protein [Ilumatobacteraceae bacterium]|jgi:DivIVA domain-containing protein|nr:DivIVA domain-containing protein [Ilumatobacteraceae bacterium]MDP5114873.1 DivIVA domain-containing protein [Ilumatobacteraceae bacterium]
MAISFSRPDPSSPTAVAGATFPSSRRGFDQNEVRDFLRMVSAELSRQQERITFLERELLNSQQALPTPPVELNEETITELLGEETARIVQAAREAASKIKVRSEETATRLVREATDEAARIREDAELEAARVRQDATSDAEAEILMAKQQGRDMVNEARAYRERVLADVARRRELAREQIEDLMHGRDRIVQVFDRARIATEDVLRELDDVAEEPSEFVNLAPTTGPIPIIVQADEIEAREAVRPVISSAPAFAPYDQDEDVAVMAAEVVIDRSALIEDVVETKDIVTEQIIVEEEVVDVAAVADVLVIEDEVPIAPVVELVVEAPVSNVVPLFARQETPVVVENAVDIDSERDDDEDDANDPPLVIVEQKAKVVVPPADDIFAKLRRSGAESVAKEVATTQVKKTEPKKKAVDNVVESIVETVVVPEVEEVAVATPFELRDAALAPVIAAMSRKLKRVLADEQNEVLDILRGKLSVKTLDAIVGPKADHSARMIEALEASLKAGALAGAKSLSDASDKELQKMVATQIAAINEYLIATVVVPLRERLSRSISQASGDNAELTSLVRVVYREWKNQHVDTQVDNIAQTSFGRGAFAALTPGTKVCWKVDPDGPACADAEDNSLAGFVSAGEAFPTGHTHAPAHAGCRCALAR